MARIVTVELVLEVLEVLEVAEEIVRAQRRGEARSRLGAGHRDGDG